MNKITKEISKCKHPNSRKTAALSKKIKKITSRQKGKFTQAVKQNLVGEKILWFQSNLDPSLEEYTEEATAELINKYLHRFDEELEQIQIKHAIGNRKNRQHASREDIIKLTMKRESDEFNSSGIEMPDLFNAIQFKLLKEWNGELRYLPKFVLKRISKRTLNIT